MRAGGEGTCGSETPSRDSFVHVPEAPGATPASFTVIFATEATGAGAGASTCSMSSWKCRLLHRRGEESAMMPGIVAGKARLWQ